jgi:chain length determinant protein EpsF
MNLAQFLNVLKARWRGAALTMALTIGLTLSISLALPKKYLATAAVVVDVKSPDPILGMILGSNMSSSYMATQLDIITSDRVAQRVVRELKLAENTQLRQDWLSATAGRGNFEAWIADLLGQQLEVKPSQSNVLNIGYRAPDPKFSAALANSFAKAYIDTVLELRVDPARQYNSFFEARTKELRTALEAAQGKLSDYQRERGILISDERLDVETQRLNELSSQLVQLQALAAESTSRKTQARSSADELQDVINNPVVSSLRADLSRQQARLQELGARLGDAHPQVQELKANIAELRSRIETETKRVSGSVGINSSINNARVSEVRAALDAQRVHVSKMKAQRDDAAGLMKDVEAAQRAYDAVAQRLTQSSLESQVSQTNVSVLTPATEPALPSSPRVLLNTLLSVFVGGLLAIAFALIRELMDRRVRSEEDLAELVGVPVLGKLPRPIAGTTMGGDALMLPSQVLGRLTHSSR